MPHRPVPTSLRLDQVRYEIRGELARRARELEAEGRQLHKLNIGNPGAFGFHAPPHIQQAISAHIGDSDPYCHQQGLPEAREAVAALHRRRGVADADASRVFLGNGVSELIDIALRALLNPGEEVLLPSPDYPLWTAATLLNGGNPRHYRCAPENGFLPDPDDIEARITARTRALVLINPNNPSGAVYPRELLQQLVDIAERHRLVLMVDEIYDGLLYDDAEFVPLAPLAGELPCLSFGGLSKVHRACGYRAGWVMLSGERRRMQEYHHALDLLGALRLCANVPAQWAIPAAIEGPDTVSELTCEGGRLQRSRAAIIDACARSERLSLVPPMGSMFAFPGIDTNDLPGFDDYRFALDLLEQDGVLIVPGSSFNVPYRNHFRVTLLPDAEVVTEVFSRIDHALQRGAGSSAVRQAAVA